MNTKNSFTDFPNLQPEMILSEDSLEKVVGGVTVNPMDPNDPNNPDSPYYKGKPEDIIEETSRTPINGGSNYRRP